MSIFLNKDSKVIVQGITGGEGTKHTALMLKALACGGLHLLLSDQLRNPHRGGSLRSQVAQETPVVSGILLLAQARSQVEHTHKLSLADERDRQLYSRRL